MAWYAGTDLFTSYPPMMYVLAYLLWNSIIAVNMLSFLSIFLTAAGIYLLVQKLTKKQHAALFSALLFLTVLNLSYYYIVVGNLPFIFAMWTLPFSMFFLEKSEENKKYVYALWLVVSISILSHIFISMCVVFLLFLRIVLNYSIRLDKIVQIIFACIVKILPGMLLAGFWLIPFLGYSNSFIGDKEYINPLRLLGFGNKTMWGNSAEEIGIAFAFFLFAVYLFLKKEKLRQDKNVRYLFVSSIIFLLMLLGVLGSYYPTGIGAIRFIIPVSILACIYAGVIFEKEKIFYSKKTVFLIVLLLVVGLALNYYNTGINYSNFSYNNEASAYGFFKEIMKNPKFPIVGGSENWRFGSHNYYLAEPLNYFFPKQPQTSGYYDQQIIYPEIHYAMIAAMRGEKSLNESLFFLDWYAVKYFSTSKRGHSFWSSPLLEEVFGEESNGKNITIYEYKQPNPIISLIRGNIISVPKLDAGYIDSLAKKNMNSYTIIPILSNENINIENNYEVLPYEYSRDNPDKIEISFNSIKKGDAVLIREYYQSFWKAKEFPSGKELEIYQTGPNFMLVLPSEEAKSVLFYQETTLLEYIGYLTSIFGILIIVIILKWKLH